jgi:hypothetical protein
MTLMGRWVLHTIINVALLPMISKVWRKWSVKIRISLCHIYANLQFVHLHFFTRTSLERKSEYEDHDLCSTVHSSR